MISGLNLKNRVRVLLNEERSDPNITLLSDNTRNIDSYIDALLPEAVLFVQMNSRIGGVNPKSVSIADNEITAAEDGSGYFKLPTDFVRLLSLTMNGWERPCTKLYPQDSAVAMAQRNRYTRAGWSKPVCVEGVDDGSRVLCFYSLPANVAPSLGSFVYDAEYNANDGLSCDNRLLIEAVAYQCAALVYNVFEKRDSASTMLSFAAALCNGNEPNVKE